MRQATNINSVTLKPKQQQTLGYQMLNSGLTLGWEQHRAPLVDLVLMARQSVITARQLLLMALTQQWLV